RPEARRARLWRECAAGQAGAAAAGAWEALAGEALWEPVLARACRALAHSGRRRALGGLLPKEGPLSLARADAWLEASHAEPLDAGWLSRVADAGAALPAETCRRWRTLLEAETALACAAGPEGVAEKLQGLLVSAEGE